jgi:hypothetical protein
MRFFFQSVGIHLESIAKELILEGGQFIDYAIYVLFDRDWPGVKEKLRSKLADQAHKQHTRKKETRHG